MSALPLLMLGVSLADNARDSAALYNAAVFANRLHTCSNLHKISVLSDGQIVQDAQNRHLTMPVQGTEMSCFPRRLGDREREIAQDPEHGHFRLGGSGHGSAEDNVRRPGANGIGGGHY